MWDDYKTDQDDIYSNILKRVKGQLPEIVQDGERFSIQSIESNIEGNRTFIRNFRDIYTQINRNESHLLKFFTNELGTSGNVEGSRAIFQGKHTRSQLTKLLDRYVNDYVLCGECGKPDTRFVMQNRIEMMKCDACGSIHAIRPIS